MICKCCPIDNALKYIGKKWSIHIIRDLFMGEKRFSEFLKSNPNLSTKMLSVRLRELEENKIISKKVVSVSPVKIEYGLTKKGEALSGVLRELSLFSFTQYSKDVCGKQDPKKAIALTKKVF